VAAGWAHTAFINDAGQLLTGGEGSFGQLGHGRLTPSGEVSPIRRVEGGLRGAHVVDIATGLRHTLAIAAPAVSTGEDRCPRLLSVFAFGSNSKGQLGLPSGLPFSRDSPAASTELSPADGDPTLRPSKKIGTPTAIPSLDMDVAPVMVTAGGDNSALISGGGKLLLWGRLSGSASPGAPATGAGEAGFPDGGWKMAAVGWRHCVALDSLGCVWAWGSSQHGQCGVLADLVPNPQRVGGLEGTVCMCVAAGSEHSVAVSEDGRLFSWGWGEHGQLGTGGGRSGVNESSPQPVSLPGSAKFAWCGSGFTVAEVCGRAVPTSPDVAE